MKLIKFDRKVVLKINNSLKNNIFILCLENRL